MSALAVHNSFEEAGLSTPTRFLMEYYDNPLTPSMGGAFSMAEANPFEYSFQPKQPAPIMVPTSMVDISSQMPPTPVSSAHSSPRQSVHEEGSDHLSEGSVRTTSPKVRTRSRTTSNKQPHQEFSSKRKWEQDDDEDGEERRRKFLERNRQAASKCRQKKKAWMQDLEQRSEEITSRNKALHETVSMLKEEVLFLKNQLLAHRGCDCTVVKNYIQTSGTFSSFLGNPAGQ
ncbi:hypothetical protein K450DRAFT_252394 [Umbelopsis ramanniana AG]|uniref:BZIP domain-containing protein n=1 Tax=Umbelopsis ramanniana AG TaxID=1314678 RepID=A0AAD5E4W0_UMBRA|nr:uncharacterized protein K450DRAFT_252394 [Umbelopsis ramanniana AG]KAI8577431.1 hypothetical protein K450DRAFT_252394 [Umbelopsis ramanniana AG]